ncbi:MAG: hypothetical protein BWZ02_02138 [Lentisphaerae bacterium ADurb.BinA184]|nr:MAG: hypothetical protein BWZ02_02138 [Lentisphaerae bacterium ADurb.BinA184]
MRLNWHRTVLHSVLLAAVVAAADAAGQVTISVTAVPDVVDTQEVFDVIVSVDTPTNLAQVVASIGFDPVIVEPVEGSFVWNGARLLNVGLTQREGQFLPAGSGNRARIYVSGVLEFKDAVSAGSGELVRFRLRGRSGGESGLTPSGSCRTAPDYFTDVPAQAVGAAVTVLGPGAVVFTPPGGLFNAPPEVTLSSANAVEIRYTTDGAAEVLQLNGDDVVRNGFRVWRLKKISAREQQSVGPTT